MPMPDAQLFDLATHRNAKKSWNILLVEDDPSDAALTELAINITDIPHTTHQIASGNEALSCLGGHCEPDFQLQPDIVFLDLSLPDKDGFAILAEIAALPPQQRDIPFVILTGSEHYQYITHSYDLWMPAYLTKPCTVEKVMQAFDSVLQPRMQKLQPLKLILPQTGGQETGHGSMPPKSTRN
jgi:CheY-like chemotaxis protein